MSGLKRCAKCQRVKPETDFNRLRDERQHWCRECFREYFRARGDLHRRQSMDALRKRRRVLRDYLDAYLAVHNCADCGEKDVRVLEFDHIGMKTECIAVLWRLGRSLEELQREVNQCEVVCVNCHRRRTAERAGWRRLDPARATFKNAKQRRNVLYAYEHLAENGCVDCGSTDPVVLEFDHVGPKRAPVMDLAWSGYSLMSIKAEIAQCEVRCCNCHRRKTLERKHWAA